MTRILVVHGPNLGGLGTRQPEIYGSQTLADLNGALEARAQALGVDVLCVQSNHEGEIIDLLEAEKARVDGLIINPGGLTHTSVALLDALMAFDKPVIEVHLSNIFARDEVRQKTVTGAGVTAVVAGLGFGSYLLALDNLANQSLGEEAS